MIILFLIIIFLFFRKSLRFIRGREFFQIKKLTSFNKKNLNNWMNLTKKERYNATKKQSISYLNKRKVLLEQIRKEYKRISKGNSEAT